MKLPWAALAPRWRATLLLAIGAAVNYGDRASMSSVLDAVRVDLALSDVSLGMLGSLFLWSYAIGSPFAGLLADRYSRKNIAVLSLAIWSIIMVLIGFANGRGMLYGLRVALGFAECLYLPAAIAMVGDHHAISTRARGMSVLIVGISAGVIAGGAFAGIVSSYYGWRPVFWMMGSIGILLAAVFHVALPDVGKTLTGASRGRHVPEAIRYLVRVPSYYVLLAKVMLVGVAVWIFFTWLPLYFRETFRMDLGASGIVGTFLPEFSGLVGLVGGAWISDYVASRFVHRRILVQGLCYLAAAPFLLLFVIRPNFGIVAVGLICFGLLRGLGDANEQSIVCEVIPAPFRSTAVGIMNTGATTAGGLGVFFAGLVKHDLGLGTIFAITAVFILIAAIMLIAGYICVIRKDVKRAQDYVLHRKLV